MKILYTSLAILVILAIIFYVAAHYTYYTHNMFLWLNAMCVGGAVALGGFTLFKKNEMERKHNT